MPFLAHEAHQHDDTDHGEDGHVFHIKRQTEEGADGGRAAEATSTARDKWRFRKGPHSDRYTRQHADEHGRTQAAEGVLLAFDLAHELPGNARGQREFLDLGFHFLGHGARRTAHHGGVDRYGRQTVHALQHGFAHLLLYLGKPGQREHVALAADEGKAAYVVDGLFVGGVGLDHDVVLVAAFS